MKRRILAALSSLGLVATVAYATSYTTYYELGKPEDGDDSWGETFRDNMDVVDEQLHINSSGVSSHLGDTSGAHAASAISVTAGDNVCTSADDAQEFFDCLDATFDDPDLSSVVLRTGDQSIDGTKTFTTTPIFSAEDAGVLVSDADGNLAADDTPDLGTPSAAVLTNATGLPISTGLDGAGAGVLSWLATPSSANLATAVTGETGSGALVFGTSPAFTTPDLGTPSAAVLTNATGLPVATGISGLGTGVADWLATPSSANLATALTGETGSGAAVFATSPTLVTPDLGTPSAAVLTNATGLPVSTGLNGLGAGVADWLGTPSSANLATAVTGETGSGALVFGTSPALTTPTVATNLDLLAGAETRYYDADASNYVGFEAPALSADQIWTLPTADGSANQVLKTDGAGALAWTDVAAGSSGGVNHIENGDAESATVPAAWVTFDDGATATPVDGTGGSESTLANVARDTDTADLIDQTGTFRLSHDSNADGQGEGWSYAFNLPDKSPLLNDLVEFNFDYYFSTASGATVVAYVYDIDNSTLITPHMVTCSNGTTATLSQVTSTCSAKLQWIATTADDYRIIFMLSSTTTTTFDMYVDNIFVGRRGAQVGAAVGPWQTCPSTSLLKATTSNPTLASEECQYKRVGDTAFFRGAWSFTNANEGTGSYYISPPTGMTFDSTKWTSNSLITNDCELVVAVSGTEFKCSAFANTSNNRIDLYYYDGATNVTAFTATAPSDAQTRTIYLTWSAPIAEWAGTQAGFGENNCEYSYNSSTSTTTSDTTSFAYGRAGAQIQNITADLDRRVRFKSAIQAGDDITFKVSEDQSVWFPVPLFNAANNARVDRYTSQDAITYGAGAYQAVSTTDIDVRFGTYAKPAGTGGYGIAGTAWSTGSAGSLYWRVEKCSGGAVVGFGEVTQNASGLVKQAGQLLGTNTNDSAATGYVGEFLSQSRLWSAGADMTTGTSANVTASPLVLTAGDWDVGGSVTYQANGALTSSLMHAAVSTTSATLPSTDTLSISYTTWPGGSVSTGNGLTLVIPTHRVSINASTTYYLIGRVTYSAGDVNMSGTIWARRVR